jgi:hypothetical protein
LVTYLDSSVALTHLLAENRLPGREFWDRPLVSSRLLQYEIWNRVYAYGGAPRLAEDARELIRSISMVDMSAPVLERALAPFPLPVRTLDALHLATMVHLQSQGDEVELASYDRRMLAAAEALAIPPYVP